MFLPAALTLPQKMRRWTGSRPPRKQGDMALLTGATRTGNAPGLDRRDWQHRADRRMVNAGALRGFRVSGNADQGRHGPSEWSAGSDPTPAERSATSGYLRLLSSPQPGDCPPSTCVANHLRERHRSGRQRRWRRQLHRTVTLPRETLGQLPSERHRRGP